MNGEPITHGTIAFTIESRILRELGERLVRQPEVALLELIKNAYDADATSCTIAQTEHSITVIDTGVGMTLDAFTSYNNQQTKGLFGILCKAGMMGRKETSDAPTQSPYDP